MYPLVEIEIEIGDSTIAVEGVTDQLPVSVLLGKDVPEVTAVGAANGSQHSNGHKSQAKERRHA